MMSILWLVELIEDRGGELVGTSFCHILLPKWNEQATITTINLEIAKGPKSADATLRRTDDWNTYEAELE